MSSLILTAALLTATPEIKSTVYERPDLEVAVGGLYRLSYQGLSDMRVDGQEGEEARMWGDTNGIRQRLSIASRLLAYKFLQFDFELQAAAHQLSGTGPDARFAGFGEPRADGSSLEIGDEQVFRRFLDRARVKSGT